MKHLKSVIALAATLAACATHAGPVVTNSASATTLANALAGTGVTLTDAIFGTDGAQAGTFSGGASTVGFDSGVVLTTGVTSCVNGPNSSTGCGSLGNGTYTSLKFNFTSDTGKIFFNYVFASEEYNEYVGSQFNDSFTLLLNGTTNIATLPTTDTSSNVVSINNVNCGNTAPATGVSSSGPKNAQYFKSNSSGTSNCANLNLDIQYDGLTSILTASADVVAGQTYSFEFKVFDQGDSQLDSAVFLQAGSFSGTKTDIPEPATLALVGLALLGATAARRKA